MNQSPSFRRRSARVAKLSIAIFSATLLIACAEEDTVTILEEQSALAYDFPRFLLDADVINADDLRPSVSLDNGEVLSMNRVSDQTWAGTVNVEAGATYKVTVIWLESFNGRDLPLTTLTEDLAVGNDGSLEQLNRTGYDVNFDSDNDGISNLQERLDGTDPWTDDTDPTDPEPDPADTEEPVDNDDSDIDENDDDSAVLTGGGDGIEQQPVDDDTQRLEQAENEDDRQNINLPIPADVIVPRISENDAPGIDGRGVILNSQGLLSGEWANAVQNDTSGVELNIDNLMIDVKAEITNGQPFRRWAAMHDGRYLYVVIIVDDNGQRFRDSGEQLINDDSLELFLDADNSKSLNYDDNDFHRIFPLRQAGARASKAGVTSGDIAGPNTSQLPLNIDFATGPGIGPDGLRRVNYERDVYELRIDLASAGIDNDAPFGFELQINDDDDGLGRDSKWGWKHPARQNFDTDGTQNNPSLMGTLKLD